MKISFKVFLIVYVFCFLIEKINTFSRNALFKHCLRCQKFNNKNKIKYCKKCYTDKILTKLSSLSSERNNNKSNINVITQRKRDIPLKIAVCAIGKNENLYIREWVEYYKNLGINKIFLYDNNDLNGERFEEVINDYVTSGFVTILNWRGKVKTTKNYKEQMNGTTLQGQTYNNCYYNNFKNYDWIAFFDIDEFLSIDYKYNDIFEFLSDFNDYDGIKVQWRMFGDNGQLYYENKPVIERFLSNNNFKRDRTVKSIIKCRDYDFKLLFGAHGFSNRAPAVVNVNKNRVYGYRDSKIYYNLPVYLNHFYSKSTEEFIKRKYKKSDATFGNKHNGNYQIDSLMKKYFQYNNVTKEKIDLFNNVKKELDGVE